MYVSLMGKKKKKCLIQSYTNIIHIIVTCILLNTAFHNILQRGNQWCLLQDNIVTNWNGRSWCNKAVRMKTSNRDGDFYGVVCSAGKVGQMFFLKLTFSVLLQFGQIHKLLDSLDSFKQSTSYQNHILVGF